MRRLLMPFALATVLLFTRCTTLPSQSTAPAQPAVAASPLDAAVPLDPAVRRGVLSNGFTYYIRTNGKPEKRAELRLVVDVGDIRADLAQILIGLAEALKK